MLLLLLLELLLLRLVVEDDGTGMRLADFVRTVPLFLSAASLLASEVVTSARPFTLRFSAVLRSDGN